MNATSRERVFIAGHRGLVGSALVRRLADGAADLILRAREELDLTDAVAVDAFFRAERPTHVYLAAARVGGIGANARYPADFVRDNLAIQTNVIHAAWKHGARKLLFLGSSCIYPRLAEQPIREEALLTGPLEPTNQAYAVAKIAGLVMCQSYRRQHGFDAIVAMPTNLYGPGDNFHPENSHVVPGLIRRFHEAATGGAREVVVWGTGTPMRELMHVDDLADALVHLMQRYSDESIVNVGSGQEVSIAALAGMIRDAAGFRGELRFDPAMPDGTPRKRLDTMRLASLGWSPRISLERGIHDTYRYYAEHEAARHADAR